MIHKYKRKKKKSNTKSYIVLSKQERISIVISVTKLVDYFFSYNEKKYKVKKNKENNKLLGTIFHSLINKYYQGVSITIPSNLKNDYDEFLKFNKKEIKENGLVKIDTEKNIYSRSGISGKIDALFLNKNNGEYYLIDWKRTNHSLFSKDEKPPNRYAGKPLNNIIDFDSNRYAFTLNIYSMILQEYEINISNMRIVNFMHSNDNNSCKYEIYEVDNMKKLVIDAIEYYKKNS